MISRAFYKTLNNISKLCSLQTCFLNSNPLILRWSRNFCRTWWKQVINWDEFSNASFSAHRKRIWKHLTFARKHFYIPDMHVCEFDYNETNLVILLCIPWLAALSTIKKVLHTQNFVYNLLCVIGLLVFALKICVSTKTNFVSKWHFRHW